MAFAPQRPQSIYGRAQVPNTSAGINWAMGAQTSMGPALAALGSMVGQRRKEAAILEQQAKEREAALALQQQSMALQQQRAGTAQAKFNLEASEYAANQQAARDLQAENIAAAKEKRRLAAAQFGMVQDAAEADEARNTAIDARFARGQQASDEADLFQFLGPTQGGGTFEQWEAANPIKASDREFSLSDWAIHHGDPDVSTSAEELNTFHRLNAPVRTTPGGNTFMQNATGGWIEVDKAAPPRQKTGDEVKDELAYDAVAAGDYSDEMSGEGLWVKGSVVSGDKTEATSWTNVDVPGLKNQTTYRVADKTLSKLGKGSHTAFKSAFVTRQKGVRLTKVDKQVFDMNGDGQLDPEEEATAKKIRSAQAVETLQQIGHKMWKHLDPTAEHPVYPEGHHLAGQKQYNVPHDIHPEDQTIVGTKRRDREQWFFAMGIDDPYEWDKAANQWVIAEKVPTSNSVNLPFLGNRTVSGKQRPMTEAEFFETTHQQSKLAKAFPPIR